MNRLVIISCLVTLSNVQMGQSQCDVVRITAAVHETLGPILNDMSQRFDNYRIDSIRDEVIQNLTHQIINNARYTCGSTEGWRHAVYLDMTDPNTNCPSGWNMTGYSKRTCGGANSSRLSCDSVFFPVSGGPYSQVCGRIRAYQHGLPDAFYVYNYAEQATIDIAYVSGVAVMHGSPRQHIWTFANGPKENLTPLALGLCPCDPSFDPVPPFVGNDYFCESGYVHGSGLPVYTLHPNDILWDGRDCHSSSTCCSFNNPPYFTKTLNHTTTDDLELRMCLYDHLYRPTHDNIAVELVELYVKIKQEIFVDFFITATSLSFAIH